MRRIRLFFQMMSANLRGMMAFKADFYITVFSGLLAQTIGLLFLHVLFQNIPSIAGWTVYEVSVLYGYMFFGEGIMTLFFQGTNGLWRQARLGILDQYMTRPLSMELQICSANINLAGAGTGITGLAVMFYSFRKLGMVFQPLQAGLLLLSLVLGCIIRVNINFGSSAAGMLTDGGVKGVVEDLYETGKYPLEIYPKAFRLIILTVIPYAAISYVPASVLLGKKPYGYFLLFPAAAALSVLLRKALFWLAMQKYEGAGN